MPEDWVPPPDDPNRNYIPAPDPSRDNDPRPDPSRDNDPRPDPSRDNDGRGKGFIVFAGSDSNNKGSLLSAFSEVAPPHDDGSKLFTRKHDRFTGVESTIGIRGHETEPPKPPGIA